MKAYGTLDLGFVRTQVRGVATNWSVGAAAATDSWLGIRAHDDLSPKLGFTVVLEQGFSPDTGALADPARSFNRQAWLGASLPLGEARVGRQTSAMHDMMVRLDSFGMSGLGSLLNNVTGHADRFDNLVSWRFRPIRGWSWQVQFAPGEQREPNSGKNRYVVGAEYLRRQWYLALCHVQQNSADALRKVNSTLAGVAYAQGPDRVALALFRGDDNGSNVELSIDGKYYSVWSLSVEHRPSDVLTLAAGVGGAIDTGPARDHARQWSLLARRDLSWRTSVYALMAQLNNRNGARFTLGRDTAVAMPPGGRQIGLQIGLRHRF